MSIPNEDDIRRVTAEVLADETLGRRARIIKVCGELDMGWNWAETEIECERLRQCVAELEAEAVAQERRLVMVFNTLGLAIRLLQKGRGVCHLAGIIDEVICSDRALSVVEVEALHNQQAHEEAE